WSRQKILTKPRRSRRAYPAPARAVSKCGPSGPVRCRVGRTACGVTTRVVEQPVEEIFRRESGRVLATLIRLLGDFDLAEEARQEAFTAAIEQWAAMGVPGNPCAWLIKIGRHKAVDRIRREVVFRTKVLDRELASAEADAAAVVDESDEADDAV